MAGQFPQAFSGVLEDMAAVADLTSGRAVAIVRLGNMASSRRRWIANLKLRQLYGMDSWANSSGDTTGSRGGGRFAGEKGSAGAGRI